MEQDGWIYTTTDLPASLGGGESMKGGEVERRTDEKREERGD